MRSNINGNSPNLRKKSAKCGLKRDALIYSALAGASFTLANLARSEGFLVMVMVMSTIVFLQGRNFFRSRVFVKCIVAIVLFVMIASPYCLFLKKHYGAWVISPKASYVMIWMKFFTYHDNEKGEEGNGELWGLNSDGKLCWQEPKGIGYLVDFLGSHPRKSISVYLNNLSHEIPGRIPNGSGMESYSQLFPVYLALAALFSTFLKWGPLGKEKKVILIAPLAIILILPVFTNGWWKYLVPYLPIVIILATKGLIGAVSLTATKIGSNNTRYVEIVLLVISVVSVGWHFSSALYPKSKPAPFNARQSLKNEIRVEAKKAGEYGFRLLGPGNNYPRKSS
jgi:4-amino-4-deoxy-L-arabinose transferase-like glycosyltransferase